MPSEYPGRHMINLGTGDQREGGHSLHSSHTNKKAYGSLSHLLNRTGKKNRSTLALVSTALMKQRSTKVAHFADNGSSFSLYLEL